jgi:hypothetical protein
VKVLAVADAFIPAHIYRLPDPFMKGVETVHLIGDHMGHGEGFSGYRFPTKQVSFVTSTETRKLGAPGFGRE